MEWVFGWIIFSLLVGWFWSSRDRGFAAGFFLSLFLSPLIGFIIGLVIGPDVPKREERMIREGTMKRCPRCDEIVRVRAKVCRYCGGEV